MDIEEQYWKLAESEHHFNKTQAGIRARASTWLLAAFAAIAVLIKTGGTTVWFVPPSILIGLVSLMASIGLLVLWINDQMVYQRLLNSVFLVGLKMEKDDPSLLPIKSMMMHSAEGTGMSRWLTYYYTIPMLFFALITASVAIFHNLVTTNIDSCYTAYFSEPAVLSVLIVLLIIQAVILLWVQFKKSKVSTSVRAGLFGDKEFVDKFEGSDEEKMQKFGDVIERYHFYKTDKSNE